MAKVMGITLPPGIDIIFNKTLKRYDISVMCNVGKNPRFFPRSKYVTLKEISYLFNISYIWSYLSDEEKNNWRTAGNVIGQHGYNLFVQDKSYRMKNQIGGNATPSIYHQFLVGHISISSPSTNALIMQENFTRIYFPCTFQISAKTSFVSAGSNPYVHLKFIWTRYYSGQNIEEIEIIDLPLSTNWNTFSKSVTQKLGIKGKWRVELELNDVQGDIWFDNLFVLYSGQIRTNDPYCDDVVKWFKGVDIPENVIFESVYPPDD